jgi:hypothetical protein
VRRPPGRNPRRDAEVRALAERVTALGVPMLAVDDSTEIAEHAASIGLLDPAEIPGIRAETSEGGRSGAVEAAPR